MSALAVVVSAFRKNIIQGLLCLLVPFYVVYWGFTPFEHPQRRPILWIILGAPLADFALSTATRKKVFSGLRGARLARRDEGAGCCPVTEEQRSQAGWIGDHWAPYSGELYLGLIAIFAVMTSHGVAR